MSTSFHERPDDERRSSWLPQSLWQDPLPPALGYIQGQPFEPVTVRPGLLGLLDRMKDGYRPRPALNFCGQCNVPTPGYSWCSQECQDQHTREETY